MCSFQSTLPRRERHCGSTVNSGTDVISIHAPVKGATQGYVHGADVACISIHAPVKGATHRRARWAHQSDFNPRSREGSDAEENAQSGVQLISIHAPAKGATRSARSPTQGRADFNPRSREGSDLKISRSPPTLGFQSTLPRRERRRQMIMVTLTVPFQSTLPRRERRSQNELISMRMEFQSTLPRRERRSSSMLFVPCVSFQSTLPRRERPAYP